MVVKPNVEGALSNLAIVGRYVLSKTIWQLLGKILVGAGGEIQLTDAIDMLREKETVEAFHMSGHSHDCGDKLGYLKAFGEYSIRDENLGVNFKNFISELVKQDKPSHLKVV